MRSRPWTLLATAMLLFASALALQQCGSAAPVGEESDQPQFKVVATVDQVMDSIVIPNAQALWDSIVYTNAELAASPKTDDDWYSLQMNAYAVAEAGNLLMIAPRAKDDGDWMKFSADLVTAGVDAKKAAESKNPEKVLEIGEQVYNVCTACHMQYIVDPE